MSIRPNNFMAMCLAQRIEDIETEKSHGKGSCLRPDCSCHRRNGTKVVTYHGIWSQIVDKDVVYEDVEWSFMLGVDLEEKNNE